MNHLDKIIQLIRENMVANAAGQSGAYTSQGDPLVKAGFDTIVPGLRRRKNGKVDYRMNPKYKSWVKNLENNK